MDKGKFPGLQQKRILAFVNHFVLDTCDFLNKFVNDCDFKFVAFENKLRRVKSPMHTFSLCRLHRWLHIGQLKQSHYYLNSLVYFRSKMRCSYWKLR